MKTINLLDLKLKISKTEDILNAINTATSANPITIATPNPEFVLNSLKNTQFKQALESFTFHAIDGAGVWMMLNLKQAFHKDKLKINKLRGSDLVETLFEKYSDGQKSFYLLGGEEGLAQKAKENIEIKYPKIKIVSAESGGVVDYNNPQPREESVARIKEAKPDILIVGLGSVKQEIWIQELLKSVSVPVAIGVGGTLGFYVNKKRAPKFFRSLNLEWLYRAFTERGHYKRAFRSTIYFPLRVIFWMLFRR